MQINAQGKYPTKKGSHIYGHLLAKSVLLQNLGYPGEECLPLNGCYPCVEYHTSIHGACISNELISEDLGMFAHPSTTLNI